MFRAKQLVFGVVNSLAKRAPHQCRAMSNRGTVSPSIDIAMTRLGSTENNKSIMQRFASLPTPDNHVMVTYVWIDGTGEQVRAKTKVVSKEPERPDDVPMWSFDGSSTGQAVGHNSDVFLKPVAIYPDPFNPGRHKLAMCETLDSEHKPTATNHRNGCVEVMKRAADQKPWFGLEQEYTMLENDLHPLGWPKGGFPAPQGVYYCSVGTGRAIGRDVCEAHHYACAYSGIKLCGTNAEVMAGQWEYQVGPLEGIEMSDQLWISRYLLHRVAEEFGIVVSFDPKPMGGDWNGAGAHINFDYEKMRKPGGLEEIKKVIPLLERNHMAHIRAYDPRDGKDNERRLTGLHETSPIDEFSHGIAHRGCSIRIPRQVEEKGYGYLEDRRPSANCDPYQATEVLVRTCIFEEKLD